MDDAAEAPNATLKETGNATGEQNADSGEEDQMLDWSKLAPKPSKASRALPKRGEKAFEPIAAGPSAYQKHTLEKAREAMYTALSAQREIQTKRLSQAIWIPSLYRAHVVDSRGVVFVSLGSYVRRPETPHKRLELLPEEILYMVERGSMLCWKESAALAASTYEKDGDDQIQLIGEPMSAQQCFTEMLGKGRVSMEQYQVYAYLKRFGYTVRRAQPLPESEYVVFQHPLQKVSLWQRISLRISTLLALISRFLSGDWWTRFHPGIMSSLHKDAHYPSIFNRLRIRPHPGPVHQVTKTSPYQVFFHVWKPETAWNRTQPTRPDFEIVVVNARTTSFPTIFDLTALYDELPTVPPLLNNAPIRRHATQRWSFGVFSSLRSYLWPTVDKRVNVFGTLKAGKNTVILAVVDAGTMSMYRFNQGCFEDWPMI
ncbi:SubName: Full=Related to tRNA-splicing endonuclease {ECO:0000313/EMBL:CCA70308.1} [Serendipita indica DSM 11827]|nr:SubName: Full=Related to tRNA-splicing endonuclease {ECO:0000313/EMBL:CCA70308.1} [Serendipita indica DSM 11827]